MINRESKGEFPLVVVVLIYASLVLVAYNLHVCIALFVTT